RAARRTVVAPAAAVVAARAPGRRSSARPRARRSFDVRPRDALAHPTGYFVLRQAGQLAIFGRTDRYAAARPAEQHDRVADGGVDDIRDVGDRDVHADAADEWQACTADRDLSVAARAARQAVG